MGVRAWCDEPIPFDGLSDAARGLRARLRESLASLEPEIDEVLHATFSGRLRPGSDVENVLLYNIDQGQAVFGAATRFGVLFERSERVAPAAPSGRAWACGYEYRLVPYPGSFREWAWAYLLANFANVPIALRGSELSAGAVWKALHDARVPLCEPLEDPQGGLFCVVLQLSLPVERPATPDLVKPLLDGVTAAFQTHADGGSREEAAAILAGPLGATPDELVLLLASDEHAALGSVDRLVSPYRGGVKWNPGDDRCVAASVAIDHAPGPAMLSGVLVPAERPDIGDPHERIAADPLRLVRAPISWERYEAIDDPPAIRVYYVQAGTGWGPGAAIAEVNVQETVRAVTIELVERELRGTFPNGAGAARALMGVPGCLEIALANHLGQRAVIDATTGQRRPRIDPDPRPHSPDRQALSHFAKGCPRWEA
jgi:hypothetical protein